MKTKTTDYLNLLFNISELVELVSGSSDIQDFLQHTVDLVARYFNADVCSIYLFNEASKMLILKATQGLNPDAVNRISMKPGEGLVGYSFDTLSVIREGNTRKNPKFKYFKEAGEDPFNSFLCVPIKRGIGKIGVLVVQHRSLDYFDAADERTMRTAVTQLAGAVENARLLMEVDAVKDEAGTSEKIQFVRGKSASSGFALGKAFVLNKKRNSILHNALPGEDSFTKKDFIQAVVKTVMELKELQKGFEKRLPESVSLIFTAHFMILKDKNFTGKMESLIDEGTLPGMAVRRVAQKYINLFSSSPHSYMQEKAVDVEDLSIRLLNNFRKAPETDPFEKGCIVVAREIYPSDILKLVSAGIKGLIVAGGGVTSHVAILSRSLQIPMIFAEALQLLELPQDTPLLMDADQGTVYIDPDPDTIRLFESRDQAEKKTHKYTMHDTTLTCDGVRIRLWANINLLSEVSLANTLKAEGIGLYRTEFPFLIRTTFPSEAEQYLIYKKLLDSVDGKPATIRTLDAGGEKALAYSNAPNEANPELGLRSIRFCLKNKDVFESQIRAILRAAAGKNNVRIMFPLVSSIDEFLEAKTIVKECFEVLSLEGTEFNRDIAIGMMIELPSVLETIDEFASQADFFSIGTNDFIQYMLAADRSNTLVADNYIPYHPAVNRGINKIVKAALTHGIDVSVCGEMAHETEHIPFLIGTGIRTLSVDPQFLPEVQKTLMTLDTAKAEAYAKELLAQPTIKGAKAIIEAFWRK